MKLKTCYCCGEKKEEFCYKCQRQVALDDGLLVDICKDCCICTNPTYFEEQLEVL